MDFLDSLNLDTTYRKSERVRSWYLYEQFKSLERNQLEAVQKLKDKSYQDRILRQELSERRARRKLYDQIGLCESKSTIQRRIKSAEPRSSCTPINDVLEGCYFHYDERSLTDAESSPDFSQDDSIQGKPLSDDYKSIDSKDSCKESIDSVVRISEYSNLADDAKRATHIAQSLTKQLDSVKEDIQCIENITRLSDIKSIDDSVFGMPSTKDVAVSKCDGEFNSNILAMWSKLVSFAYQAVKLHHGNCYYDYSSQLMTAVLICDLLRRGVSIMSHILQPFVTPIKFASDDSIEIYKYSKRKKENKNKLPVKCEKHFGQLKTINKSKTIIKRPYNERTNKSDNWRPYSKSSLENLKSKYKVSSEPMRRRSKFFYKGLSTKSSCNSIWPDFSRDRIQECDCWCHRRIHNPTVKMLRRIDSFLKEIDYT